MTRKIVAGTKFKNQGKCPVCGSKESPHSGIFWNRYDESVTFAVCKNCKTPFNVSADGKYLMVIPKTWFPKSLRWMFKE